MGEAKICHLLGNNGSFDSEPFIEDCINTCSTFIVSSIATISPNRKNNQHHLIPPS